VSASLPPTIGLRRRRLLGRWGGSGPAARVGGGSDLLRRLLRNRLSTAGVVILLLILVTVLVGPLLWTADPNRGDLGNALAGPSGAHPLGTDTNGRDVLARVLHGGRVSIAIALLAICGGLLAGTLIGLVAGFLRGPVDAILMRLMDVMMALPSLLLAITIVAIAGPGVLNVALAVGIPNIPFFARVTRSVVISVREREFVLAARASGVRRSRIMSRHVLANSLSPVVVAGAVAFGFALLDVATLGFLGLGVQPPQAEWGAMLVEANQYLLSSPIVLVGPGLAITLTAMAGNLVGDALNDALEPGS
jgi:peptide/nickel transport system permease protein